MGAFPSPTSKFDTSRNGAQASREVQKECNSECKSHRNKRRYRPASPTRFNVASIGICASSVE
ncbi:hypothetical protein M422DRAFT_31391 [Sphaerobolus stellatus SS14]|uniref:Unplaced genomic scaffold SPHSTscaffold_56, whole genome shotgun sequence n=1 Tax=Sphaerobolus stellatus (strain SS14) TaxID=990650 RepID=A0A0C9U2K9_SPHS4|nr:hypothetical protein M422DRAFT_39674 [Sphaerobolus stellatus SS14]KIJ42225.1 hypothetical protein M422DRAFT_31391 [Sphaerobolus stellatus SS14]